MRLNMLIMMLFCRQQMKWGTRTEPYQSVEHIFDKLMPLCEDLWNYRSAETPRLWFKSDVGCVNNCSVFYCGCPKPLKLRLLFVTWIGCLWVHSCIGMLTFCLSIYKSEICRIIQAKRGNFYDNNWGGVKPIKNYSDRGVQKSVF